jgi:hypothetical protein
MPGSKVRYGHGCRADAFSCALPMTVRHDGAKECL